MKKGSAVAAAVTAEKKQPKRTGEPEGPYGEPLVLEPEEIAQMTLAQQRELVRLMVAGQIHAALVGRTNRSAESAARDAKQHLEALEEQLGQ